MALGGFNVFGRLSLSSSAYRQGLKGITAQTKAAGNSISSALKGQIAAVLGAAAIIRATKDLVEYAAELKNTSQALDVSTDSLQKFFFAAEKGGASQQTIINAFQQISKARLIALKTSTSDESAAFTALGIDEKTLQSGKVETIFRRIAEKIRTTDFGSANIGILDKLVGGTEARQLLTVFGNGLDEVGEQLTQIGGLIDEAMIMQLNEAKEQLDDIAYKLRVPLADAFVFAAIKASEFWDKFRVAGAGAIGFVQGLIKNIDNVDAEGKPAKAGDIIKAASDQAAEDIAAVLKTIEEENDALEARLNRPRTGPSRDKREFEFNRSSTGGGGQRAKELTLLGPLSNSLLSVGNFLGKNTDRGVVAELKTQVRLLTDIKENTRPRGQDIAFPL